MIHSNFHVKKRPCDTAHICSPINSQIEMKEKKIVYRFKKDENKRHIFRSRTEPSGKT